MRIFMPIYEFPPAPGGVQNVSYQLARHFNQLGHEVLVLTIPQPEDTHFDAQQVFTVKRLLTQLDYKVSVLHALEHKWDLIKLLSREISDFAPQVILCPYWDPIGYLIALITLVRHRIPYFVIGHGTDLHYLSCRGMLGLGKKLLRYFAFHRAKRVFVVSRYTAMRAKELRLPENKISRIPNGIEEKEILLSIPDAKIQPIDTPHLLTVCRLVPRKGCDTVIKSLPHLVDRYPNLKYYIVGSGPEYQRLQELTEQMELEQHVVFWGRVDEEKKHQIYQQSHVFVMPVRQSDTDYEGFGIVFLEAMARGLPVIGANTGGIPDAIEHNVTGILVSPDNPVELAKAIRNVLEDGVLRSRLITNAWLRLKERFLWRDIAKEYIRQMSCSVINH